MTPRESELLEAELGRLRPAQPPPDLAERLVAAQPAVVAPPQTQPSRGRWLAGQADLVRWLAPALGAALGLVALLVWWLAIPDSTPPAGARAGMASRASDTAALSELEADDVEFDRQLVAAFEAVATLPTGEPVRFRCREWNDEVIFQDSSRGVVIEQRTPRLEVVPVRYETY